MYDYKESIDEIMDTPLSAPFFMGRMELFSGPRSFIFYGTLGVDYFSSSELLYPNMKE